MTKQAKLDKIQRDIVANNVCPELSDGALSLIMGEGSLDAKVVFIGEAPGRKEDELGRPFVGASGKFLNEMLASINLAREDVYITNIVKYRPPDNRDPRPAEKLEFWPYLVRQLQVIRPQVVVTLGRHSMEFFLPGGVTISEVHGQPQQVEIDDLSLTIVPLYHPAYALYNGKIRQTLKDDFAVLVRYTA